MISKNCKTKLTLYVTNATGSLHNRCYLLEHSGVFYSAECKTKIMSLDRLLFSLSSALNILS